MNGLQVTDPEPRCVDMCPSFAADSPFKLLVMLTAGPSSAMLTVKTRSVQQNVHRQTDEKETDRQGDRDRKTDERGDRQTETSERRQTGDIIIVCVYGVQGLVRQPRGSDITAFQPVSETFLTLIIHPC